MSEALRQRAPFSPTYWTSLRYFNLYRLCLASILFVSSALDAPAFSLFGAMAGATHRWLSAAYWLATALSFVALRLFRQRFNMQLSLQVVVDVLVLVSLMHLGGGLRSGLGAMLLVTLAGAGLVGQGRLVLFYAALATLAVLFEQSYRAVRLDFAMVDFFQAGLFCAGFFGVAISARLLARRVVVNEELARQRGIDLKNQMLVSQRAIEEMQDGVLVLHHSGWVRQHNPRAAQLLGLDGYAARMLADYSPELAEAFAAWCDSGDPAPRVVRMAGSGAGLRVRFVATDSSENEVLVFLEDMGRLQEQAQQLKLAALGRLTANIAHEIRNPLSAINHAAELLREAESDATGQRLLRIVLDNTQRVERIVNDVLELGRRDRMHREAIDLRQSLPVLVEEYVGKENLAPEIVCCAFSGRACLLFDRSHLHQVMWNLLGNALRHGRRQPGSVRIEVRDAPGGGVEVHVVDDGEGVDAPRREQIFEPFFTTHSRGTGLGLYIARELCEANGAHLELVRASGGADFCISGRSVECQ